MPVSAYVKAGLFVVAAAAALFAAAGTVAIPGFWAYLAIFAVVMIVSFAALDPDLLRERMRPGGKCAVGADRQSALVPSAAAEVSGATIVNARRRRLFLPMSELLALSGHAAGDVLG